jgi:hypothetical protein
MNSSILKTEALCWLRYGKKLPYVCTEGGYWNADVLGVCDTYSVEVEVKMSKADLKREFQNKASKHYLYNNADGKPARQVPNYFYFYVPPELEQEAVEIVTKEAPKAGVIVYAPGGWLLDGKKSKVVRRATKLHDKEPSPGFRQTVVKRMGSELCGLSLLQHRFLNDLTATLKSIHEAVPQLMKKMFETPDIIEESNDPTSSSTE